MDHYAPHPVNIVCSGMEPSAERVISKGAIVIGIPISSLSGMARQQTALPP